MLPELPGNSASVESSWYLREISRQAFRFVTERISATVRRQ